MNNNIARGINIYLAGKIAYDDWRHRVVSGLREANSKLYDFDDRYYWPILENSILGEHNYTGPFFISCDHGCFHKPHSHGYGPGCSGEKSHADNPQVNNLCKEAIDKSDLIFAWIDAPDAYGSIFELGYAVAKGIPIFLAISEELKNRRDLWFIEQFISNCRESWVITAPNVAYALNCFYGLNDLLPIPKTIKSPIEEKFFREARRQGINLEPQFEVLAGGHNYRIDFAISSRKLAIELDGHEYHKTKEQRTDDAKRERALQKVGWAVIRFTGTEVFSDVYKCVSDVLELASLV
jgi:very-short-patch-repair endonuclease